MNVPVAAVTVASGHRVKRVNLFVFPVLGSALAFLGSYNDFFPTGGLGWPGFVAFIALTAFSAVIAILGLERFIRPIRLPGPDPTVSRDRGPQHLSEFRGRGDEIDQWIELHRKYRAARAGGDGAQSLGPVVLDIHGAPGVGKSFLAHELARRLKAEYEGYLVVNFGSSGTARGPADICRDLLFKLGWPVGDLTDEADDRVATLRSLTRGRKLLFLFDAARDHDQVRQVLPAEPGCTVIVTSRRDIASALGLPPRPPLATPSLDDCLDMFQAISGHEWTDNPELAVAIIEHCGRLPLAIRSVAERVRDGNTLYHVAAQLSDEDKRLPMLDYNGRRVIARIESEYLRLQPLERVALSVLTTVESDTFVPWVLRPLLEVDKFQSTGLIANLAAAQMLELVGQDGAGRPRYRINPLIRLYAAKALPAPSPAVSAIMPDLADVRRRFNTAYADLLDDVLSMLDDGTYTSVRPGTRLWRTPGSAILKQLDRKQFPRASDDLLRREYPNVVRALEPMDDGTHAHLIWRVAARLEGCVPPNLNREQVDRLFQRGIAAAQGDPIAIIAVQLARAQFLVQVEEYGLAFDLIVLVESLVAALGPNGSKVVRDHLLRIGRIRASAYVQLGLFKDAEQVLRPYEKTIASWRTDPQLTQPGVRMDLEIMELLSSATGQLAGDVQQWQLKAGGDEDVSDAVAHRRAIERSDTMRRRQYWREATSYLIGEVDRRTGDARAQAGLEYRLARLLVEESQRMRIVAARATAAEPEPESARAAPEWLALGARAISHAASSVLLFRGIHDEIGIIRARCMLVRALVAADRLIPATQIALRIQRWLSEQDQQQPLMHVVPLTARYLRARGELEFAYRAYGRAQRSLGLAADHFEQLEDWAARDEVWSLLDLVRRASPEAVGEGIQGLDEHKPGGVG